MKNNNSKTKLSGFGAWLKERVRKILVALKKNPQFVPLLALCASFLEYSLNLTEISNTTAKIQGLNMGLAAFVTMLFMMLSFVCMLNAFPKRQKPKTPMIILMMVLYGAVIWADIHYMTKISWALYREENPIPLTESTMYIYDAYNTVLIHVILIGVTIVCVLLEPVFAKLFKKINTSIDVEGSGDIQNIDISDED
jgi:hypothetical protein